LREEGLQGKKERTDRAGGVSKKKDIKARKRKSGGENEANHRQRSGDGRPAGGTQKGTGKGKVIRQRMTASPILTRSLMEITGVVEERRIDALGRTFLWKKQQVPCGTKRIDPHIRKAGK